MYFDKEQFLEFMSASYEWFRDPHIRRIYDNVITWGMRNIDDPTKFIEYLNATIGSRTISGYTFNQFLKPEKGDASC